MNNNLECPSYNDVDCDECGAVILDGYDGRFNGIYLCNDCNEEGL